MKARSNSDNIMPYIQADAAFCMFNIYRDLKKYQEKKINVYICYKHTNRYNSQHERKILMISLFHLQFLFAGFLIGHQFKYVAQVFWKKQEQIMP